MNTLNQPFGISAKPLLWVVLLLLIVSCNSKKQEVNTRGKLKIVTTTGMLEDAIKNIAHDNVSITSLMGPGVDPHLYKATQGDLRKLTEADIIFYNGLHLEGKMGEVLQKLGKTKTVIGVGDQILQERLRTITNEVHDPHIWFDVTLWKEVVSILSGVLSEKDSTHATEYHTNTSRYIRSLDSLHVFVTKKISEIPEQQRVLITAHDAFGYFGDAYHIEVRGLQGISTVSEFGLKDVTTLVNFIIERKIKSIFVETSVSEKSIEAVVEGCTKKGWKVQIGGSLYSDAMGQPNTPEGTYIGMVTKNVETITNGLR